MTLSRVDACQLTGDFSDTAFIFLPEKKKPEPSMRMLRLSDTGRFRDEKDLMSKRIGRSLI